ncbi:uncharacterized protein BJX67DRAFT_363937 [Aspergillus lucknowensis]|uniref:Uncharacterized protein n=1 Tax=Aspergillus lucknowensis TaxID=176173 RepID=A0ABR4LJ59_9EURO
MQGRPPYSPPRLYYTLGTWLSLLPVQLQMASPMNTNNINVISISSRRGKKSLSSSHPVVRLDPPLPPFGLSYTGRMGPWRAMGGEDAACCWVEVLWYAGGRSDDGEAADSGY